MTVATGKGTRAIQTTQTSLPDAPAAPLTEYIFGHPSVYTPQIANAILLAIATTADTIESICKRHGTAKQTVYGWAIAFSDFSDAFAKAKHHRAHALADKLGEKVSKVGEIVDNPGIDTREKFAQIQGVRVQTEYTKWRTGIDNPHYKEKGQDININVDTGHQEQAWANRREVIADISTPSDTPTDTDTPTE